MKKYWWVPLNPIEESQEHKLMSAFAQGYFDKSERKDIKVVVYQDKDGNLYGYCKNE